MTTRERITQLREERANVDTEQKSALEAAATEGRALTAEERQADDNYATRFTDLSEELRRYEGLLEREQQLRQVPELVLDGGDGGGREERSRREILASDEYRGALDRYVRTGLADLSTEERSVLQAGTDADGGFTVAETWRNTIIESQRVFGAIRTHAEVITTETGGDFHLPRVASDAALPTIVPEGTLIPDDAEAFDEVILKAYKYARITKANDEAVQDLGFDVGGFVTRRLGEDISLVQAAHFATGSGVAQPLGLFTAAPVGVTTAAAAVVTADEVVKLVYSVTAPYRANGRFLANDLSYAAIRTVKDNNGNYVWQYGLQQGQPDRLLGYPIDTEPFVDNIAATKKPIGFGDIFRAYVIRDAGGMAIRYLTERYADLGQVAWRGTQRSDGNVKDVNAFKTLQLHA